MPADGADARAGHADAAAKLRAGEVGDAGNFAWEAGAGGDDADAQGGAGPAMAGIFVVVRDRGGAG